MFTIYSKPQCTYCEQAKALLNSKNLPYDELIIDIGQPKLEGKTYVTSQDLLAIVPTAKTVPQVLEDGRHIGGFKELQQFLGGA